MSEQAKTSREYKSRDERGHGFYPCCTPPSSSSVTRQQVEMLKLRGNAGNGFAIACCRPTLATFHHKRMLLSPHARAIVFLFASFMILLKRIVPLFLLRIKRVGDHYYCTCMAWRNQGAPVNARTCKHLREHLGDGKPFAMELESIPS